MNDMTHTHRGTLLKLARDSIAHGLEHGHPLPVAIENQPQELRICAASFVTLRLEDELRGCIGTLEAIRPLAVDISANAWAAAFATRASGPSAGWNLSGWTSISPSSLRPNR